MYMEISKVGQTGIAIYLKLTPSILIMFFPVMWLTPSILITFFAVMCNEFDPTYTKLTNTGTYQ